MPMNKNIADLLVSFAFDREHHTTMVGPVPGQRVQHELEGLSVVHLLEFLDAGSLPLEFECKRAPLDITFKPNPVSEGF